MYKHIHPGDSTSQRSEREMSKTDTEGYLAKIEYTNKAISGCHLQAISTQCGDGRITVDSLTSLKMLLHLPTKMKTGLRRGVSDSSLFYSLNFLFILISNNTVGFLWPV